MGLCFLCSYCFASAWILLTIVATPLIYSVDGMAGREAQAFEKRIAHLLVETWERHYSVLRGFVRGRMALPEVRSNTLLLRGSRMGKAARFAGQDGAALSGLGHVRD